MRRFGNSLQLSLILIACLALEARAQTGPFFGDSVSLGATPSDIVLDEGRTRLHLVNSAANRIDVHDYSANQVTAPSA